MYKDGSSALVVENYLLSLIIIISLFFHYCFSVAFSDFDVESLKKRILGSKAFYTMYAILPGNTHNNYKS